MIKYIGSKRRLVPVLARICRASGATTARRLVEVSRVFGQGCITCEYEFYHCKSYDVHS